MAKGPSKPSAASAESELLAMIGYTLVIAVMMFGTIWFTGSNRIVYYTAPLFKIFGWLYNLVPGGQEDWGRINYLHDQFRAHAKDVSIDEFWRYTDLTLRPLAYLVIAICIGLVGWTFTRSANKLARKPSPDALLRILSTKFTGTIPVMHLGPKLIADQLPGWRQQTWPEELLQQYKVEGRPLLTDNKVNLQQVRKYFQGEMRPIVDKAGEATTRRMSRTLGIQLVDVLNDRGKTVCYPDRMSPTGKVMFALLVAHAFGGKPGKADYNKARDELNRSCLLHPEGLPNLTVAQWIFDKYRTHEKAHQLFAVHHWEYTYLYALFFLAKRQGKVTHREWLWLKPTNRILFYVLNTVLRKVPHTESAAVFTQFDLERKVGMEKRIPIFPNGTPAVITTPPEEAITAAWEHFKRGVDEDSDAWWADGSVWLRANNVVLTPPPVPGSEALVVADSDPRFDNESTRIRHDIDERFNAKSEAVARGLLDEDMPARGKGGRAGGSGSPTMDDFGFE